MTQLDAFDMAAARVLAVANHHNARRTDPQSSHAAGRKVEANGKASDQRAQCLQAVERFPGHTSQELADKLGFDRYMLARRLPELRQRGLVRNGTAPRECTVTGNLAMAWWPV